ncbi:MAG: amidohydrolase family protein [Betaproteobacteria bacterium]|nr:amidohydrolase family protein [Betaproteobacteria bacterium]
MKKPRVVAPAGATDTHMHFYIEGTGTQAPGTFLPGHFPVEDYQAMQKRLGLERVVVVQPNAYADNNTVTLECVGKIGLKKARGVAVVKRGVADAELDRLTKGGMCAIRIMTLHGGTLGFDVMDELMARVHPFGWHANIQLDGRELPKYEAQIKRLPGRFVIDHTAKFLEPVSTDHESFKCLLRLVDTGRCWVKLSAPYETSKTGAPKYEDVSRLARALVKHAPERMMWASNWPHPSARKPQPPDDADLLDLLLDWAPEERTRNRILADNPAELYGFK